ncbi:MAG: helix-turn-helix transcriptional regulator [Clostridia bacterium]|nr:helix-turn-helix transcriptional regulator [Clostridia bacterium]
MYLLDGELEISLNGKPVHAKKGEIVAVNSSVLHSSKIISSPLDYYILIVNDEFLKNNSLYGEHTSFFPLIRSEKACEIFDEIIAENEKGDKFSTPFITGKIIEFSVLLNREFSTNEETLAVKEDKRTAMIKDTLDYLNSNFKRKISVDEIATELAFSKSYLSHAFKEVTGYTLISYLNLLKCQSARALIINGYSIKQASIECGFSDLSYFTRTFKKTMGKLPSEIKK